LTLNDEKTLKREIRALQNAKEELKTDAKLILLTLDNPQTENNNVKIINVIKWLLFV